MNPWQTQSEANWDGTSPGWLKQGTQYCKYARWQSSSKLRSGKGTQPDSSLPMRHSCQKTRERTVENGQQANKNQRSSFSFKKTANHKISQCTLMAQSPKTSKARLHPWRQCGLYGLSLQLDNGGGSSHPCLPLECLKRWQSDHTYANILADSMRDTHFCNLRPIAPHAHSSPISNNNKQTNKQKIIIVCVLIKNWRR